MKNKQACFYKKMPNPNLGIDIFLADQFIKGRRFKTHWHDNMQFYYFIEGEAIVECSQYSYQVKSGDLIVINNNELHALESLSSSLKFYSISIDSSFLFSHQMDLCQAKFLGPLAQGKIAFKHFINDNKDITNCIHKIIKEHLSKEIGYELAIKASILELIVLLLRQYIDKQLTPQEETTKLNNLNRFKIIFDYVDENYSSKISNKELSNLLHVTPYHFCRLFKEMTGKTPTVYINSIRLEKAVSYLLESNLTITEVALRCGFDSINYFSRLFKKQYNVTPREFRNKRS